jgi:hypothetical protein
MSRLVALNELKRAWRALDDEHLLDQRAQDRVLAVALGAFRKECDRALAERTSQQLPLEQLA